MADQGVEVSGDGIVSVPVTKLMLDPNNPRLPEDLIGKPQDELLAWMHEHEVLDELAKSMVSNGFFAHEPLIVLPADRNGFYTVVEGNRRLAALQILLGLPDALDAGVSFILEKEPSRAELDRLREVPCFVSADKEEVHRFLGFRHIGGLKTWSPEAKARYVEAEVERAERAGDADAIRTVARQVGSTPPAIRAQYLSIKSLRAAQDEFGVNTAYVLRERFGVWHRLLNSGLVREFIALGEPRSAEEIRDSVLRMNPDHLREVVGHLTPVYGSKKAVLQDSRDVTIYGAVLANSDALETLREFNDLDTAKQLVERGELPDRLRRIQTTISTLTRTIDHFDITGESENVARAVLSDARSLHIIIKGRLDDDED